MSRTVRHSVRLPPPVTIILLYAADGLSCQRGQFSRTGKPRTPERAQWVPLFRHLVQSDEGLQTLHSLAKVGAAAWNCPPDIMKCLDDAFLDRTFRALSITALQRLADTAPTKIAPPARQTAPPSPQPPSRSNPRPAPPRPQPARPDAPQRPSPQRGNRPPSPT